jgi:hypothetical protein
MSQTTEQVFGTVSIVDEVNGIEQNGIEQNGIEQKGNHLNGDNAFIGDIDAAHAHICEAQHRLLRLIVEADRRKIWHSSGARDLAHWLSMRHGISQWKARRWIDGPRSVSATCHLLRGELGISRWSSSQFATGDRGRARRVGEGRLLRRRPSQGDLETSRELDEAEVDRARTASWWYFDYGRRFGLQAELAAAEGAVVAKALARIADELPRMPGERGAAHADARRADALVALASTHIADDADPDRATVVVHAQVGALISGGGGSELEEGPVIHNETARRLLCNARVQAVIEEDGTGRPIEVGRMSREPSAWMMRQLRYRDHECRFPGCGSRRFTQAHHIVWWERGGSNLDNLVLVCVPSQARARVRLGRRTRRPRHGRWIRPDGSLYRAGPPRLAIPA